MIALLCAVSGLFLITVEIFPDEFGAKELCANAHKLPELSYSVQIEIIFEKSDIDIKIKILGDKKYDAIIEE